MEVPRSTNRDDWIEVRAVDGAGQARVRDCGLQKDIGAGKYIPSATFSVGGPDWRFQFYPAGFTAGGVDVSFKVEDEVLHAHKIVLAMRSPVFKVELYGPMRDKMEPIIIVEDMQPAVFKALLHFIYTDSLPGTMENLDKENKEMIKLLLVAADRYAMETMKLMCENILSKRLDVGSVATTLALADQHHCSKLKDACIQFINSYARMNDLVASEGLVGESLGCPVAI
ncbi:hypothetical protein HU200_056284 [Digitaria exilis]|uniref:BTB domain-containing protein n=1 Tax=Digitaria exilis TaxID=1010633 RepID=A0A835AGD5_9POAL|nr:hypothetical protein HU200_056284 [Digitaria exilis]